ncbi:MAG: hypothetical protein QOJ74_1400 [Ilumatobacteraceae bacterium]|nr:hypothetical protein [Ilumatobacteraceae bacterium]
MVGTVVGESLQPTNARTPIHHERRTARGYVRMVGDPWHDVAMRTRPLRRRLLGNTVVRTVLSVWAWLVLGVVIIVWVPLVAVVRLVTAPFDKGRYAAGYLFRRLTVVHQWLNPLWRFRTSGLKVKDPRRPYIVVANHQSFVDILLISQLPWEMKWLSKEAFFRYPLVGWMMRMAGDVPLVRGSRDSIVAAMDACRDRLEKHVSVMIFPEGTRSSDGELQKFKPGAFRLAIETGTPILPLALDGTHSALQKGDWRFGVTDAEVRVLEPIETTGLSIDDVSTLRDRVYDLIADELALMKAG